LTYEFTNGETDGCRGIEIDGETDEKKCTLETDDFADVNVEIERQSI
jgi:hypothetical protein